jgi:hypothetical protein
MDIVSSFTVAGSISSSNNTVIEVLPVEVNEFASGVISITEKALPLA